MPPLPRCAGEAGPAGCCWPRLAREVEVRDRRVVGTGAGRRRRPQRCTGCCGARAVSWAVAGGGWPDPRRGRTEAERLLGRARHECEQRSVLHHARVPHRVAWGAVCRERPSALRAHGGAALAQPKQLEVEREVRLAPRDRGAARRRGGARCRHRSERAGAQQTDTSFSPLPTVVTRWKTSEEDLAALLGHLAQRS